MSIWIFFTILLLSYPTSPRSCLHIPVCMSIYACLHVHVFLAAGLHVHAWLFYDFAPVIPHKSQVMSAYPCLHVRKCMSACPCLLSCMFACPFGFFLTILLLSYPTSPRSCLHIPVCMSIYAFLHVHVFLAAGLHVHAWLFYDFAPVIPHKSQVMCAYPCLYVHTCISACPCLHVHVCMPACLC